MSYIVSFCSCGFSVRLALRFVIVALPRLFSYLFCSLEYFPVFLERKVAWSLVPQNPLKGFTKDTVHTLKRGYITLDSCGILGRLHTSSLMKGWDRSGKRESAYSVARMRKGETCIGCWWGGGGGGGGSGEGGNHQHCTSTYEYRISLLYISCNISIFNFLNIHKCFLGDLLPRLF